MAVTIFTFMAPSDAIFIKDAIASYYPRQLHSGIILHEVEMLGEPQWNILWSDGSTATYAAGIIRIGWVKV
jgi:hypothetical protein